jgi:hypothetical protein
MARSPGGIPEKSNGGVVVLNVGEIERSETIFRALEHRLAESYLSGQFTIRAFCQTVGWVRNGNRTYAQRAGEFLMAEVHPLKAPAYRFMILKEDALEVGTHEAVLMFIQLQSFPDFERTDGKQHYYQFIPQRGNASGELKAWEPGTLNLEAE